MLVWWSKPTAEADLINDEEEEEEGKVCANGEGRERAERVIFISERQGEGGITQQ